MALPVAARGVSKRFERAPALAGVTVEAPAGSLLALVGPNGAGKTTLLRLLVGLLAPDAGEVTVGTHRRPSDADAIRRVLAFVPATPHVPPSFRVEDYLEFIAEAYGVAPDVRRRRSDALLAAFRLDGARRQRVGYLSDGNYKKTALAGALAAGTPVLVLDEPFTGEVDPFGIVALQSILGGLAARGRATVVFATQILDLAHAIATHVCLLHEGRVRASGTMAEVVGPRPAATDGGLATLFAEKSDPSALAAVTAAAAAFVEGP